MICSKALVQKFIRSLGFPPNVPVSIATISQMQCNNSNSYFQVNILSAVLHQQKL